MAGLGGTGGGGGGGGGMLLLLGLCLLLQGVGIRAGGHWGHTGQTHSLPSEFVPDDLLIRPFCSGE